MRSVIYGFMSMAIFLIGCSSSAPPSTPEQATKEKVSVTLHFLAASSTVNVAEELARAFEKKHGVKVTVVGGSSNALAQQILNGAPADLFLSANQEWIEPLEKEQLIAEVHPLLGNMLIIAVPKGNPSGITTPEDLFTDQVKRVALAADKVPAGIYAETALTKVQLYDQLVGSDKIVRGQDVRITLSYLERGEVDAAVVYATDVVGSEKCESAFEFPVAVASPIVLPLALLKNSKSPEQAKLLFDELRSTEANAVYQRWGFTRIAE